MHYLASHSPLAENKFGLNLKSLHGIAIEHLRCNFTLACEQFTRTLEQFTHTHIELLMVYALLLTRNSLDDLQKWFLMPLCMLVSGIMP